jgi:hypothetical protein
MTSEEISKLTESINRLHEVVEMLVDNNTKVKSPAVTPEDAARLLGWPVAKSRGYTRKLKFCRDKGFLSIFYAQRPYHYDRKEVEALAEKIRIGKVYIPSV